MVPLAIPRGVLTHPSVCCLVVLSSACHRPLTLVMLLLLREALTPYPRLLLLLLTQQRRW